MLISLESVFHFRSQWNGYRSTEQLLAREYLNFVTREGTYCGKNEKDAFLEYVVRVETLIAAENASTLNVMTTLTDRKTESAATLT